MGRLTKEIKDEVVRLAVKETFDKRDKSLAKKMRELAKEVYADMYSEDELKLLLSLPRGWARTITKKRVYFTGCNGLTVTVTFDPAVKVANDVYDYSYEIKSEGLKGKLSKFVVLSDKIRDQKHELVLEVRRLLKPITTTKHLLEVWPESVKYYQEEKVDNLPAVNSEAVRKRMQELQAVEDE